MAPQINTLLVSLVSCVTWFALVGHGLAGGPGRVSPGTRDGQPDSALILTERDFFRDQAKELKLRLEALGADFSMGNGAGLEQKLFKAVSDLRLVSIEKERCTESLLQLVEATNYFRSVSTVRSPDASSALEGALRSASNSVGLPGASPVSTPLIEPSLINGRVVSVNQPLSCAVINVGSVHGVVRGMPFRVSRDGVSVCEVRVLDVRERLSGALIEAVGGSRLEAKTGDSVAFLAQ